MLRDYQIELAKKTEQVLRELRIAYLSMEMRVGKTLIALKTAELIGVKNVLFVTKKKAIYSIQNDYRNERFNFALKVINYEQLDKEDADYDLIVVDESHNLGAFPKPSKRTMRLKKIVGANYLILLSGTPSPESYSQLFHQFWISDSSSFKHKNFYKWAHEYVEIKEKWISGIKFNDYTRADKEKIMQVLNPYFISYTREEAGFKQNEIVEEIKLVDINPKIDVLVKLLLDNKFYEFRDGRKIVCDSAVKLQNKIHQIYSGSVICEDGSAKVLDLSKIEFITQHYKGKKIAIFYKFIAEGKIIKSNLSNYTENPEEFNQTNNKIFVSQILSGSMGINLSSADVLIFYNIDFSATLYWQSRARLMNLHRDKPPIIHWLFSNGGIEKKIYDTVLKKRSFTTYYFKKLYLKDKPFVSN
jgi:SNF2 family DNA or RNA helicase